MPNTQNCSILCYLQSRTITGYFSKDGLSESGVNLGGMMNIQEALNLASEIALLHPYLDFLREIARPAIELRASASPAIAHGSRFGGAPFVPPGFLWPQHEIGHYRFLGQFNLSDIEHHDLPLPANGLLSFFYVYDEEGTVMWHDEGYIKVFYWDDFAQFTLYEAGEHVHFNPEQSLELVTGIYLPPKEELRTEWPFDAEAANEYFYYLVEKVNHYPHYLLGYPSYNTKGYDPTPGDDWQTLLNLGSDQALNWCWLDGRKLMLFIEKYCLRQGDFSRVQCDAG